jgi:hypothetical protein
MRVSVYPSLFSLLATVGHSIVAAWINAQASPVLCLMEPLNIVPV